LALAPTWHLLLLLHEHLLLLSLAHLCAGSAHEWLLRESLLALGLLSTWHHLSWLSSYWWHWLTWLLCLWLSRLWLLWLLLIHVHFLMINYKLDIADIVSGNTKYLILVRKRWFNLGKLL